MLFSDPRIAIVLAVVVVLCVVFIHPWWQRSSPLSDAQWLGASFAADGGADQAASPWTARACLRLNAIPPTMEAFVVATRQLPAWVWRPARFYEP
jgi:hypothetical protein